MATFGDIPGLKCRPHPPHDSVLYATAVAASQEYVIPEGMTRSRAFRFNVARLPASETRPSRGPWLAIGFCCSRRVIAYYGLIRASESLPATYEFEARAAAPKEIGFRWESRGSPIYSAGLCSRAASHTPVAPKSAIDCFFLFGISLHPGVTGSATTLEVSRLQSSLIP